MRTFSQMGMGKNISGSHQYLRWDWGDHLGVHHPRILGRKRDDQGPFGLGKRGNWQPPNWPPHPPRIIQVELFSRTFPLQMSSRRPSF